MAPGQACGQTHPAEDAAPDQDTVDQAGHPWLEVQLDTCTVAPESHVLQADNDQAMEALRQALLAALRQDVGIIRLDLARAPMGPRALALFLDFSRHLRALQDARRLVLANCPEALRETLRTLQVQTRFGIASS